jgi:hypothetical protein
MEIPSEQGARLQKMFVGIEGWQARVELDPLVPAEHSSLAADDKAFPLMPTSQVAYNGISVRSNICIFSAPPSWPLVYSIPPPTTPSFVQR